MHYYEENGIKIIDNLNKHKHENCIIENPDFDFKEI